MKRPLKGKLRPLMTVWKASFPSRVCAHECTVILRWARYLLSNLGNKTFALYSITLMSLWTLKTKPSSFRGTVPGLWSGHFPCAAMAQNWYSAWQIRVCSYVSLEQEWEFWKKSLILHIMWHMILKDRGILWRVSWPHVRSHRPWILSLIYKGFGSGF